MSNFELLALGTVSLARRKEPLAPVPVELVLLLFVYRRLALALSIPSLTFRRAPALALVLPRVPSVLEGLLRLRILRLVLASRWP